MSTITVLHMLHEQKTSTFNKCKHIFYHNLFAQYKITCSNKNIFIAINIITIWSLVLIYLVVIDM